MASDWIGVGVTYLLLSEGANDRLCEAEVVKGGQWVVLSYGEMRRHDRNRAAGRMPRGLSRHPAWSGLSM